MHPSFGPVPPEQLERARNAPAGECHDILKKYAPSFGVSADAKLSKYIVRVTKTIETQSHAVVEIEAYSKEDAENSVDNLDWDDFDWKSSYNEGETNHSIDEIEESK